MGFLVLTHARNQKHEINRFGPLFKTGQANCRSTILLSTSTLVLANQFESSAFDRKVSDLNPIPTNCQLAKPKIYIRKHFAKYLPSQPTKANQTPAICATCLHSHIPTYHLLWKCTISHNSKNSSALLPFFYT